MKPGRWASSSAAIASLCIALGAAAASPVLVLDSAQFLKSEAAEPPPDAAPWQPQALPDNWRVSRPQVFGYAWYRLRFDVASQPTEPYAAFMPWLRSIGAVYVNGVLVGRTGPFGKLQISARPELFVIPPRLLHAGSNTFHIRLFVGEGWRGALSAVTVGEDTAVRPYYERRFFVQITGAQLASALAAALGAFMLILWLRRRSESLYAYFGLGALGWATTNALMLLHDPPLSHVAFEVALTGTQAASTVFLSLFALRYAGLRWPRVEKALWVWAAAEIGLSFFEYHGLPAWLSMMAMALGYCEYFFLAGWIAILARAGWQRPPLERTLVLVAVTFVGGTFIRDMIAGKFLGELDSTYQPYRAIPMCIAIGWALVDRFVHSLNESERLNAELEQRVAHKHAELEQNYGRMNELERQRAVAAERQRIMSDMHDGVGGQLISTLSLLEQGDLSPAEVATALRECLDDLRLTIDSLEPTDNDLLPVLGNLRYRLDERLRKQGIELDWRVSEVPKLACMSPQSVLHVLRILQEAFTNVLRHSHASAVQVETGVDAEGGIVYIRVRDNGRGFADERAGRGFANMRRRAQVIGATLQIDSSPSGTVLTLLLPVLPIPHSGDGAPHTRDSAGSRLSTSLSTS